MAAVNWHLIQGVFLSHDQCSHDRLWIHCDLEQVVTESESVCE